MPIVVAAYGTLTIFQHEPDHLLRNYNLVQSRNVGMYKLSVVVNLACEVGIVLLRRLEHDLCAISRAASCLCAFEEAYLGAIAEFMRRQIDFSEAAFAYELS